MSALLKRPSGFVPLLISAGFLVTFAIGIAQGTLVRQADEDTGAHLFQILMPVQLFIIVFFAFRWVPQNAKPALQIVTLQLLAALSVFAIVYFRHL
jgi:hypothetical protein